MANEEGIGRVINRNWRVVRKIGQGGMGTVWEVRHKDVRRLRSAVKEIKAGLSANQEVVRRFLREVRLMAELEGVDHIVRVTEFDRQEGFVFMTLVDGPSLAQIIERQGAVGYEQVLRFGRQIAAALGVVHERGIVHRDIKPPNVLVDEKQQKAYLTDFGIAKKLDLSENDETIDGTLTLEGTLTVDVQYMGTPRYSSPEQLRVEYPPHPLWDIYAMGVLLYEAYSGLRYLQQFRKYHEFLKAVGSDPAFEIALQYRTPPPPSFAALVEHCIERDAGKRLQSAAELGARLQECEDELRRTSVASGIPLPGATPGLEDQETQKEEFRDPRRELREEIERRFGALDEIEGTLVAVGLNLPAGPASETLGHALRDISLIEGDGQFQEALGRLEALREQAAAAHARAEEAARVGLEQRVAALGAQREDLDRRAGRWLDATLVESADAALAVARRALADAQWKAAGDAIAGVPAALKAVAEAARRAAEIDVVAALAETSEQLAALQGLDAGAVPRGFDLAALRAQAEARLGEHQLEAAARDVEAARGLIAAALERARAEIAEQIGAARASLERRLAELDVDAARRVAPDAVSDLERARAAADHAEAGGDLVTALAAYAQAHRAADSAGAQVASAQAEERRGFVEALRAMLTETADAPAEVVGEARAAAQALLERLPAEHAAATTALNDAGARLAAARDELPAFSTAAARRDAAGAARAAGADLLVPRAERRKAEAAFTAAMRAFEQRQWVESAASFEEAQRLWESLAAGARTRNQQEQCAALRGALREDLESLAGLEAERRAWALPPDDTPTVTALRDAVEATDALEQRGDFEEALARLGAVRERAGRARTAHEGAIREALGAALAALGQRYENLAQRAGGLLEPPQRADIERLNARAETAARGGDWVTGRAALADADATLEQVETDLRKNVEDVVRGQLAAVEAGLNSLAELRTAPPQGLDLDEIGSRAAALLRERQLAAARQLVDGAFTAIEGVRAARQRELSQRARTAGEGVEASLRGIDLDLARAAVPAQVERAERLHRDAAAAEQRGAYIEAIDGYEAAAAAVGAAATALDEHLRAEISALTAGVREGLQQVEAAPALLAEAARTLASAALADAERADHPTARRALESARAALAAVLADTPAFEEAEARRAAAQAAQETLARLPVSADEQAPARRVLDAGSAALERREWTEARARFGEAQAAFDELVRAGRERQRIERELAAERAAAQDALGSAVERARSAPLEVVGEALRAAEALLGEAEPGLEDLQKAGDGLARAVDDVPSYTVAVERRAAAEVRQGRVAQRRVTRRQLKPARQQLRAAAAAIAQRQWTVAADHYAEAERLLGELESLPPAKPARWPYAIAAVLLLGVTALVAPRLLKTSETGGGAPAIPQGAPKTDSHVNVAPEPVAPPPPVVAHVPHIASFQPADADVSMNEGGSQTFSIQLADASGDNPDVEWSLAGKSVSDARGKTAWDYRPDYTAAAGSPYDVTVKVGSGGAEGQTRSWHVSVADQNRLPEVVKVQPPEGQEIRKDIGQTASFSVEASDPDGDQLAYQWSVDGKPYGGNTPRLDVPVERDRETVALAITDGRQTQPLHVEWKLSGSEAPWGVQPATLKQLTFGAAQPFKVTPPSSVAGVQIAWAVNGQKVADGPSFLYQATDPALVGSAPVQVRATGTGASGKPFTKDWSFTVAPPPPPKLTAASPAAGTINAAPGVAQKLALTAAPPVNGQRLTYVFDVNGKQTASTTPSLSVAPSDNGDTLVVASIEDNFKQRSKETHWTLRPPPKPVVPETSSADLGALVHRWLDQYRGALNSKDVATQCSLLQLDAGKCAQLGKALDTQSDLKVTFDDVQIAQLPDGRASAHYTRVDQFVDPAGKAQTKPTRVAQTFRLVNGQAQLDKSGQ